METITKMATIIAGAFISFVTGMPPLLWVLVGIMSVDFVTGLMCAAMGKSQKTETGGLSSRAATHGLYRKCVILLVVLLAVLLDYAVAQSAGMVSFSAVTGMVCMWFIASEGLSILENAATIGLPVPEVLLRMLEMMRSKGEMPEKKGEE